MPIFRVTNLVDKQLSDDVSASTIDEAFDTYLAEVDRSEFSHEEWQSLPDNLLIEIIP